MVYLIFISFCCEHVAHAYSILTKSHFTHEASIIVLAKLDNCLLLVSSSFVVGSGRFQVSFLIYFYLISNCLISLSIYICHTDVPTGVINVVFVLHQLIKVIVFVIMDKLKMIVVDVSLSFLSPFSMDYI